MEFHRLISARRSLRAYSGRPVEPEKVERMLEAARWSPSCANRQPWRFLVVGEDSPSRAAETVQVMFDYSTGRPRPIDDAFLDKIRDYIGG